ncbi:phosphopantetheinyl transferase-like protein [Planomonospora sp. ID67723]|uniref:4'-phosphopantetheinyl transferase family protein n=1 Tax=Planomonospora sp. ID67723 TaxID=2738134 RepID=UPI0018C3EC57|nr:4'-phosphopantetheinyl transferase family protein [Planomonospora sp. ID67723]MBG0829641.1 phosphopantetheinyl transferase-like protein [Planomonospora sp. ID67723]
MHDSLVLAGPTDEIYPADGPALLTEIERDRAARFVRESDRRDFIAAHVLVRRCAARITGVPEDRLTLLQVCELHGPGHGRPYLAEIPRLGVSLSHSRGYVCAAAGPGRIGVDAEHVPPGPLDESLAEQSLAAAELPLVDGNEALIRLWVRKEALVKRGELNLDGLRTTDLSALPLDHSRRPRALEWEGRHLLEWRTGPDGPDIMACAISDHPITFG